MLSTLSTLKARLAIDDLSVQYDDLLTTALTALSARFDKETNRTLSRTANSTHEFRADDTEIVPSTLPLESVSKFELKSNETEGWVEQTNVEYLLRNHVVISLTTPLGTWRQQARITYTGGYVLPGDTPGAGQNALPADLEQAAVEQVAYWFQNREKLGLLGRSHPQKLSTLHTLKPPSKTLSAGPPAITPLRGAFASRGPINGGVLMRGSDRRAREGPPGFGHTRRVKRRFPWQILHVDSAKGIPQKKAEARIGELIALSVERCGNGCHKRLLREHRGGPAQAIRPAHDMIY
jgi:hypothetical protein